MVFKVLKAIENQLQSMFSLLTEQYFVQHLLLKFLSYLSEHKLCSLWYTLGISLAFFVCVCVNMYLFVQFGMNFKF